MKKRKLKHSHHAGTKKSRLPHDFISFCSEAIKNYPKNATPYFFLAHKQCEMGDLEDSVINFDKGLKLNPFNITALNNLAFIYIFLCEYPRAIERLSAALGIDPDSLTSLLYRGKAYRLSGRLEDSIHDYDHAIECWPDNAEAYMGREETKILQQDLRGAFADYTYSVMLDPSMKEKHPWIVPSYLMTGNGVLNAVDHKRFLKMNFRWLLKYWVRFRELFGGSLNGLILLLIIPFNEEIIGFCDLVTD